MIPPCSALLNYREVICCETQLIARLWVTEAFARVLSVAAQFFFYAKNLVVFCETFGTARSASLNLKLMFTNFVKSQKKY